MKWFFQRIDVEVYNKSVMEALFVDESTSSEDPALCSNEAGN